MVAPQAVTDEPIRSISHLMSDCETLLSAGASLLNLTGAVEQALVMVVIIVAVFLAIILQFLKVHEMYGGGDSAAGNQQTNCSSCGARNSIEAEECEYCGDPIDTQEVR